MRQAFLDYAHIATRLPELHEELQQDQEFDAVSALQEESEELTRSASKLIGVLPDALRDRSDSRHNAALADMIENLVKMVDNIRPALASPQALSFFFWQMFTFLQAEQPTHVDAGVALTHIQSSVYAKFMKSIDSTT